MKVAYPAIRNLLPHQGDSVLLNQILEHDLASTTCSVDLSRQRWLKDPERRVASWLAIEYMAQCMTVHESLRAQTEHFPLEAGMLVSLADLRLNVRTFEDRQTLRVKTEPFRGRIGLRVFSHLCQVFEDEEKPLARARLTIALESPPAQ